MRFVRFLFAVLTWSLPAAAQQPLVDCFSTYDCCVQRHGMGSCAPSREGALEKAAGDALKRLEAEAGTAAEPSFSNASLATAIDGKKLNSYLKHVARHLARILNLEEVGGIPPGEEFREETQRHWWREVKDATKNIQQVLKRCRSRRQIVAALSNVTDALTEAQIADVEARLLEATRKMGDEVGELLPCGGE